MSELLTLYDIVLSALRYHTHRQHSVNDMPMSGHSKYRPIQIDYLHSTTDLISLFRLYNLTLNI